MFRIQQDPEPDAFKMQKKTTSELEIPDKFYFKIGEVSRITGVPSSVLRYWETEFKNLTPKRTDSGQRLYQRRDIDIVLEIKHLLYKEKFTIQGANQYFTSKAKHISNQTHSPDLDELRRDLLDIRKILLK